MNGMQGWGSRTTPVLQRKKKSLPHQTEGCYRDNLEKDDTCWKCVIWSDEVKLEVFGHRDVAFIGRKKGAAYNANNMVPTVTHSGSSMML